MNRRLIISMAASMVAAFALTLSGKAQPAVQDPIATVSQQPGFCSIFLKWGFIGDSLCSGEHECHKADGKMGYIDLYQYSWGQYMCRAMGATGDNYSQGGETAEGWIKNFWNSPHQNRNNNICAKDDPKQAYIIALGVNDRHSRGYVLGNPDTDINLDDFSKNAGTYTGNYAGIIQRVKSIQPKAKIFVVTVPGKEYAEMNEVIRAMAVKFSDVYVIDLAKYGKIYEPGTEAQKTFFMGGHLNAMGYEYTAWTFMTYIDHIIRSNPEDFKQAAFIGTEYQY